jgi:ATP-dependent helicase/nuclease subunit A
LVEETEGDEKVWRFRETVAATAPMSDIMGEMEAVQKPPEFPVWLRQPAQSRSQRSAAIAPSGAAEDTRHAAQGAAAGSVPDREKALQRGQIVHRLMQALPDLPAAARDGALERYLGNVAHKLSADEQSDIARQVLGILDDSRFAEFFAAGSRPEVPIIGRIARPGCEPALVAGQIDRLRVTADAVLIVDYKTDSAVPSALDRVPAHYITQLAFYRAVLMTIYPGKRVRTALLFSAGPHLTEIPDPILDAALKAALNRAVTRPAHAPVSAA